MGSLVFKCGWLAAWQWSAGDLYNGKKGCNLYSGTRCVRTHSRYTIQICASGYKNKLLLKIRDVFLFWFGELLYMCQSCQRSSLCLFYSSVSDKSQHSAAVAHWPESLKCKYKHINVSMHAGRHMRQGFRTSTCMRTDANIHIHGHASTLTSHGWKMSNCHTYIKWH